MSGLSQLPHCGRLKHNSCACIHVTENQTEGYEEHGHQSPVNALTVRRVRLPLGLDHTAIAWVPVCRPVSSLGLNKRKNEAIGLHSFLLTMQTLDANPITLIGPLHLIATMQSPTYNRSDTIGCDTPA